MLSNNFKDKNMKNQKSSSVKASTGQVKFISYFFAIVAFFGIMIPSDVFAVLTPSDLTYQGSFRVPTDTGAYWLGYGGFSLAYNNDSLFTICKTIGSNSHISVTEISIPEQIDSDTASNLNRATTIQPCTDVSEGEISSILSGETYNRFRGVAVFDDKLYYSFWSEFNPDDTDLKSQGYSNLDFDDLDSQGSWYLQDTYVSKFYSGYLFVIPESFASTYLSGKRLATGVTREGGHFSRGPALFAHDANSYSDAVPPSNDRLGSTPLILYTETAGQDNFPDYEDDSTEDWRDGVWIDDEGKEGIIFIGRRGSDCWYGSQDEEGYDECSADHGYHCDNHNPALAIYDPEDLVAVAQGSADPWDVQPSSVVDINEIFDNNWFDDSCDLPVGIEYDSVSDKLYISQYKADGDYPIVHVFSVNSSDTTSPSYPTGLSVE
jgi:hypothetical protein